MNTRVDISSVAAVHNEVRAKTPLVQYITNFVSMDIAANVLNAAGASPAMVHDVREAGEFATFASALAINIGTLSPPWVAGMEAAARTANELGTPWVLDPVAVGATAYRRETVTALLEHRPTVIRGNASEILAIATQTRGGKGVDSTIDAAEVIDLARELAGHTGSVVVVSGKSDVVTDGQRAYLVHGGHDLMPLVTALGCASTALVAACNAVEADPVAASVAGMAILAAAGSLAGIRAEGPGSLRWRLLDELAGLDDAKLIKHIAIEAL